MQSLQGIRNPRDVSSSSIKKFIILSIISSSISSSIHSNSTVLFLVQNIFQIISPQLNPASCSRPAYSLKNMFTICNIWDQFPHFSTTRKIFFCLQMPTATTPCLSQNKYFCQNFLTATECWTVMVYWLSYLWKTVG